MKELKTIAITGATGQQGGAVAHALLNKGFKIRALTRNPNSAPAEALRSKGAEIVATNFDEPDSLESAFKGSDSAFIMSTPFEKGVEAETEQGIRVVDTLKAAGLSYLVFTSVAGADRNTGIPHFDSKYRIEQHIKESGLQYTIIAPVFFYQNMLAPFVLPGLKQGSFAQALPAARTLQCVSIETIGTFAALVFTKPEEFLAKRINLAGDEISGNEFASVLSNVTGKQIVYIELPLDQVRAQSEDMARMYEWFNRVGYSVDIKELEKTYPEVSWPKFGEWAEKQDWTVLLK